MIAFIRKIPINAKKFIPFTSGRSSLRPSLKWLYHGNLGETIQGIFQKSTKKDVISDILRILTKVKSTRFTFHDHSFL